MSCQDASPFRRDKIRRPKTSNLFVLRTGRATGAVVKAWAEARRQRKEVSFMVERLLRVSRQMDAWYMRRLARCASLGRKQNAKKDGGGDGRVPRLLIGRESHES